MYLLICAVNSYLYNISMESKVYMSSSLRPHQYVMQSSVVILGIKYQHIVDNATRVVQWLVHLPGTLENPGSILS